LKDWDEDFGAELDDFLIDEPLSTRRGSDRRRRPIDPFRCSAERLESGDLFALLAIPWSDQETTEFLRLVGIDDAQGN
jgi:hypothetical protein